MIIIETISNYTKYKLRIRKPNFSYYLFYIIKSNLLQKIMHFVAIYCEFLQPWFGIIFINHNDVSKKSNSRAIKSNYFGKR